MNVGYAQTHGLAAIFTARCYASAVLAMGPCQCLSQVGVLSKRLNESSWFLACELSSRHIDRRNVLST